MYEYSRANVKSKLRLAQLYVYVHTLPLFCLIVAVNLT